MSFRKEKKFKVTIHDYNKFQNLLFNQGMKLLHVPRLISSIYFDTKNLQMFYDSEEGTLPRKKIRVRWYNNNNHFVMEKKISSVEGRYKTKMILTTISDTEQLLLEHYFDNQYGNVIPSLKISYIRSYFNFNSMRITFDEQIKYQNVQAGFKRIYTDPERIVEIKIPITCSDDYIEKYIPYATSRFSKYSRGILLSSGALSEF